MVSLTNSLSFSFLILASFATLLSVADARRFYVGGNGAWVMNPRESYNTWAERNRFQVNDTLYFKYGKGSDSVQRVMKADYDGCNVRNLLEKFDNGETEVKLNQSGPFYFISGNQEQCLKGQKLIVVVLAVRHQPKVPVSPAKAPSTAQPPKAHSPVSPPAKAPSTTQPPKSSTPVSPVAPAKSPSTAQPPRSPAKTPKAHSPVSPTSPAKAPSTSQPPKSSVSPSHAPSMSPATHSSPSKSPSSSTSSPTKPPMSSPSPPDDSPATPAPEKTPPSSPTPSGSTPAADSIKAPAPSPRNAASGVAVTSVLTTVLGVAFTVLMVA